MRRTKSEYTQISSKSPSHAPRSAISWSGTQKGNCNWYTQRSPNARVGGRMVLPTTTENRQWSGSTSIQGTAVPTARANPNVAAICLSRVVLYLCGVEMATCDVPNSDEKCDANSNMTRSPPPGTSW